MTIETIFDIVYQSIHNEITILYNCKQNYQIYNHQCHCVLYATMVQYDPILLHMSNIYFEINQIFGFIASNRHSNCIIDHSYDRCDISFNLQKQPSKNRTKSTISSFRPLADPICKYNGKFH